MPNTDHDSDAHPLAQAALFFALGFVVIQGAALLLQGTLTLPAAVTAAIAALTGAGIVYSYECKRQAGFFETPESEASDSEARNEAETDNGSDNTGAGETGSAGVRTEESTGDRA
ncbi:MAG: hypothetical protein PPP56_00250 [Longimonas sp.]|uniref:hypothetical protein n=1 Tax=Longimonas sp. TaxID=2039626 RepID=UPI003360C1C9